MRLTKTLSTLVALATVAAAGPALAIPAVGQLAIDFRTQPWAAINKGTANNADNLKSRTVEKVTVTGFALGLFGYQQQTLSQNSTDGLGVFRAPDPGTGDEVSPGERIRVDFAEPAGNGINGVWITNLQFGLFDKDAGSVRVTFTTENDEEITQFFDFSGKDAFADGTLLVSFVPPPEKVVSARFDTNGSLFSDFSIAGFTRAGGPNGDDTPLSEPGTLVVIGSGLLALGLLRRRRRAA